MVHDISSTNGNFELLLCKYSTFTRPSVYASKHENAFLHIPCDPGRLLQMIPRSVSPERRGRGLSGPELGKTESWDTDLTAIQVCYSQR